MPLRTEGHAGHPGTWGRGVLRKELSWQVGGTAGRPACLRRGSGGPWRALVSEQWAAGQEVGWKPLDGPEQGSDVV